MLTYATASLTTIQGIELGFFDQIPADAPITAHELSSKMSYDISRVERWLKFAVAAGYVAKKDGGFILTQKGGLLSRDTPFPDLLGLHYMVGYFTRAISASRDAFQRGVGLDSITKGKISREYIPRVASQLSRTAAEFFKWSGVSVGHTILDLGCGDGSVLRETVKTCPGISAIGLDINPLTVDIGKNKNEEAGLQDQIDLQVGDVTSLSRFKDDSIDWVCAINVFHFLPAHKREHFLREMIRISRYGVFTNQVMTSDIGTIAVDVLLSTLFTDFTGFFSSADADRLIAESGVKHHMFLPIIQGESRLVVLITSQAEIPSSRISAISEHDRELLRTLSILTAKDLLTTDPGRLAGAGIDVASVRAAAVKLLFP